MNRAYLGAGEIKRMRIAERIVTAFQSRKSALNIVTWSMENPEDSALLIQAGQAAENE